jgi:hypothetical protein
MLDLTGHIRTYVPLAVAWVLSALGSEAVSIDSESATQLITALVFAAYYAAARALEARWPAFGWLLGSPKAPRYGD